MNYYSKHLILLYLIYVSQCLFQSSAVFAEDLAEDQNPSVPTESNQNSQSKDPVQSPPGPENQVQPSPAEPKDQTQTPPTDQDLQNKAQQNPPSQNGQEQAIRHVHHSLQVGVPITLRGPSVVPEGFEANQIGKPYELRYHLNIPAHLSKSSFLLDANLNFTRSEFLPLFGIAPGISFEAPEKLISSIGVSNIIFSLQLDFQNQTAINSSPYTNSQFDILYGGPLAKVILEVNPNVAVTLAGQVLFTKSTQLANFESISTLIDHKATYVFMPSIVYKPISSLELIGGVDLYTLGATAIASKEFAFATQEDFITKWNLGVAYTFGNFKIRATDSIVSGVKDDDVLNYQAPFLSEHYLLSRQVLTLELIWNI